MTGRNQASLAKGEITPLLYGRVDLQLFQSGLKKCRGFIVLQQGGVTTTPGTKYIAAVANETVRSRLIPFLFAADDTLQLEFSENGKIRFYKGDSAILSGGVPYEVSHPYTYDQIGRLSFSQSADVLYMFVGDIVSKKLMRFADDNWSLVDVDFTDGPFLNQNIDEAITITASAATGSITLTGAGTAFDALHVGSLWKLEQKDSSGVDSWMGGVDSAGVDIVYSNGELVQVGGNTYKSVSGTNIKAGVNPPNHTEGTVSSGKNAVSWEYLHSGFGVVKITGQTNATSMTATVLKRLPDQLVTTPTFKWFEGAFSEFRGHPSVSAWYEQRLMLAATRHQPTTIFGSVSGDFENMEEGKEDDAALQYVIVGHKNQVNKILWMVEGGRLMVGTAGSEFTLSATTLQQSLTPTNVNKKPAGSEGSRAIAAEPVDDVALFTSASGARIHAMGENPNSSAGNFSSPEISITADHLTLDGIVDMAYARDPYRILWMVRSDGKLIGVTYRKDQEIVGWHQHDVGGDGFVENISVKNSPDGTKSELWMVVRRTVGGAARRFIERQQYMLDYRVGGVPSDAWYLYSAVQYKGAATNVISGLDHLEGEVLSILADGAVLPDQKVSGGTITLTDSFSTILAGIPVNEREIRPLNPNFADNDGSTAGRKRRVRSVAARFIGSSGGIMYPSYDPQEIEQIRPSGGGSYGSARKNYSGVIKVPIKTAWDREDEPDADIVIAQPQPLPLTCLGFAVTYDVAGKDVR